MYEYVINIEWHARRQLHAIPVVGAAYNQNITRNNYIKLNTPDRGIANFKHVIVWVLRQLKGINKGYSLTEL